jgi:type I restriction enzyme, S subunit
VPSSKPQPAGTLVKAVACLAVQKYIEHFINFISVAPYVTGSAQPKVTQKALNRIPVVLPPHEEQKKIIELIKVAMKWLNVVAAERDKAVELFDHLDRGLLAKAFRGELVPQDPNEEPAETLLDRIRAERASAPAGRSRARRKAG